MMRILLVLVLVAVLAPPAGAASPPPRSRLEQVLSRLAEQRRRLQMVRQRERRALVDLEGIDRTQEQVEQKLAELEDAWRVSRTREQAAAAQLAATQRDLTARRQLLGARLRETYRYGRTGYADVLLGAGDFGEFVVRWHLIATVVRADTQAIQGYADAAARYAQLQVTLRQEQAYIRTLTEQTEARRRDILGHAETKRAMLVRLQAEREAYDRVVRELERNSRDLEGVIRRTQGRRDGSPVALARGLAGFLWPARGMFTSGFGVRRHPIFGIRHLHTGVDIAAVSGTPVLAAADGRVIYAGWFGGYGRIVAIDHGGGTSTMYAHLSRILVATGDPVRRGQPIARVGSTGFSTGPHLHFEIRINGRPVDPTQH